MNKEIERRLAEMELICLSLQSKVQNLEAVLTTLGFACSDIWNQGLTEALLRDNYSQIGVVNNVLIFEKRIL